MLKKIAIGVLVLVLIIAGAVHYLFSNLDSIVKAAIEKYGTEAIQTDVRLDSVKLSISSGEGSLSGLSISNPKGFKQPKAFYLGSVSIKLDTSSVTGSGPIVIRELIIEKPQVTYEVNNDGQANLQTIEHSITASAGASTKNGSKAGSSGHERKIIINDLYIRDGEIGINQDLLANQAVNAPLPTIHLTNIGKQQGGATPEQVAEQILGSVIVSSTKVASDEISKTLGSTLKGAAGKNVGNQLKGMFR